MTKFSLISRPLGTVERLVIAREDGAELEILTGWGAGLNAWRVPVANGTRELLFGYRDEKTFRETQADTSAGERLSPWPGRTNNAVWQWNGNSYKLDNNVTWAKHSLHGLTHTKKWSLVSFESDEASATLKVAYDWTGNHAGFPFPFRAETAFTFTGESVTVKSYTKNVGQNAMPYAEGWHPYFMLGQKVDTLTLSTPESERLLLDSTDIPTGERVAETRFEGKAALGDTFINDCFALKGNFESASTVLASEKESITISQKSDAKGFRQLVVYTPPDRNSIAIEPMTSEPDVLNHHREMIVLNAGEELNLEWSATFKA